MYRVMRCWSLAAAVLALPCGVSAQAQAQDPSALSPELVAVRAALDKYQDPILAVHDGYFSTLACMEYSAGGGHGDMAYQAGGMGVHFLNPALVGPKLDPMKPQVLIYEPVDGKLKLVAAEWFMPTAVSKVAPAIFGQTLQGPMAGHEPVIPASLHHWDLHVWLWKANPSGVFSPTNPDLHCAKSGYGYSIDDHPPEMVAP